MMRLDFVTNFNDLMISLTIRCKVVKPKHRNGLSVISLLKVFFNFLHALNSIINPKIGDMTMTKNRILSERYELSVMVVNNSLDTEQIVKRHRELEAKALEPTLAVKRLGSALKAFDIDGKLVSLKQAMRMLAK
ncbi:hypothetical protein GCS60_000001 [Vibrio metschnikovii]|nr:hypothetical protein [Vibrio metschnikovii]